MIFARLRRHLTLWYSGVLAGMLLLFGIVLYLSVHQLLFGPVQADLKNTADSITSHWQRHPGQPYPPDSELVSTSSGVLFSAVFRGQVFPVDCFDPNGVYLPLTYPSGNPVNGPKGSSNPFVKDSLVSQAIQNGSATETINYGGDIGDVYVYAQVVPDPGGDGILGVVQVAELVNTQEAVLNQTLILLLILGAATLFAAAVGGLLLADRALAPTRLAFARQQAFIADASHELRTPLTLMRADAEVLLSGRGRLDPDDVALLEDIVIESGHMTTLANSMLTLARLDAGEFHLEREVVDLASVATRVAHRVHAFAREKQVTVQVEQTRAREPQANQALVIGDKSLLEQATMILVDNAIKYNRSGGSVTLHAFTSQGQACLEVSDTGIGIAAEHLAHLGERFYRVDKARSREAGGAGLGLSIARGIAASHGGALTLSSTAGQGAVARITLPAAETVRR
ncbi:MAG TPA: ATP-binding protein [Ktedonobacterales bacterium]|jgi:signal transduction histidine kinase